MLFEFLKLLFFKLLGNQKPAKRNSVPFPLAIQKHSNTSSSFKSIYLALKILLFNKSKTKSIYLTKNQNVDRKYELAFSWNSLNLIEKVNYFWPPPDLGLF